MSYYSGQAVVSRAMTAQVNLLQSLAMLQNCDEHNCMYCIVLQYGILVSARWHVDLSGLRLAEIISNQLRHATPAPVK